jgi:hypothetical protein
MEYTYFPIELGQLAAAISYHDLNEGIHTIGGARVATQYLNHPATTLGYRVEADGVAVVYLVDHEPFADSLWRAGAEPGRIESILHDGDRRHAQFMAGADLVIHDAQYTPEEYPAKKTWGHSTYEYVVQICAPPESGVSRSPTTIPPTATTTSPRSSARPAPLRPGSARSSTSSAHTRATRSR